MHFARICAAMHCCWSLCEQQILKLDIAVTQAFFQADFDTAALINEGCFLVGSVRNAICQDLCSNALLLVSVRATNSQTRHCSDTSLLSGCCLDSSSDQLKLHFGSVCAAVHCCCHCGGGNFSNRHGSAKRLLSGCCLYSSSDQ